MKQAWKCEGFSGEPDALKFINERELKSDEFKVTQIFDRNVLETITVWYIDREK